MSLKTIVDQTNFWNTFSKNPKPQLEIHRLTKKDADFLFYNIDGDLSPENLCCDGELSAAETRKKYNRLQKAIVELKAKGFTPPIDVYNL